MDSLKYLTQDSFEEDMEYICSSEFIPWKQLQGKTIFVTGATGLIGYTLVNALIYANQKKNLNANIIALVRDEVAARKRFPIQMQKNVNLEFVVGNVEKLPQIENPIDYIIHGASQTSSKAFVETPVETIQTALDGMKNVLELAKKKEVKGFVYMSSMEVYGHPEKGYKVTENDIGRLSSLNLRNSYPISKLQCESLCCAYAGEYGLPVSIVRLAQTFGPGVHEGDHRIFAEMGRCVLEKQDIVLHTKGKTERSYLYTADAVTAILTILLKGTHGQAYNAANEDTYCSIAEMAHKVAELGGVQVCYDQQDTKKLGYPEEVYMDLDTSSLRSLGWNWGGGKTGD